MTEPDIVETIQQRQDLNSHLLENPNYIGCLSAAVLSGICWGVVIATAVWVYRILT